MAISFCMGCSIIEHVSGYCIECTPYSFTTIFRATLIYLPHLAMVRHEDIRVDEELERVTALLCRFGGVRNVVVTCYHLPKYF